MYEGTLNEVYTAAHGNRLRDNLEKQTEEQRKREFEEDNTVLCISFEKMLESDENQTNKTKLPNAVKKFLIV